MPRATVLPPGFRKVPLYEDYFGYVLGDASRSALIVLQEFWGLNGDVIAHARRLHDVGGYRVLLPDLYRGVVGLEREETRHVRTVGSAAFGAIPRT